MSQAGSSDRLVVQGGGLFSVEGRVSCLLEVNQAGSRIAPPSSSTFPFQPTRSSQEREGGSWKMAKAGKGEETSVRCWGLVRLGTPIPPHPTPSRKVVLACLGVNVW